VAARAESVHDALACLGDGSKPPHILAPQHRGLADLREQASTCCCPCPQDQSTMNHPQSSDTIGRGGVSTGSRLCARSAAHTTHSTHTREAAAMSLSRRAVTWPAAPGESLGCGRVARTCTFHVYGAPVGSVHASSVPPPAAMDCSTPDLKDSSGWPVVVGVHGFVHAMRIVRASCISRLLAGPRHAGFLRCKDLGDRMEAGPGGRPAGVRAYVHVLAHNDNNNNDADADAPLRARARMSSSQQTYWTRPG
jgi:hypothetical protein